MTILPVFALSSLNLVYIDLQRLSGAIDKGLAAEKTRVYLKENLKKPKLVSDEVKPLATKNRCPEPINRCLQVTFGLTKKMERVRALSKLCPLHQIFGCDFSNFAMQQRTFRTKNNRERQTT